MRGITLLFCTGLIGSAAVYLTVYKKKAREAEQAAEEIKKELDALRASIWRKRVLMLKVAAVSTVAIYVAVKVRQLYIHVTSPKQIK